jgi:signal peptidase II
MPSLTLRSASSAQARLNATSLSEDASIPRSRCIVYVGIASIGCLADLLTKHWVFKWLGYPSDSTWWLWENYVGIQTALNRGALFGMGEGGGRIFAGLSILAAFGIVIWLFVLGAARSAWLTVALSFITGGILGNLYDRLGLWVTPGVPEDFHYAVRDWILIRARHEKWTWPNFNIADSLLVTGAIMLLWQASREESNVKPIASQSVKADQS